MKNNFSVQKKKKEMIVLEEAKEENKKNLIFKGKYGRILLIILMFICIFVFTIGVYFSLSAVWDNSSRKHDVKYYTVIEYTNNSDKINFNGFLPISDEDALDNYSKNKDGYIPYEFNLLNKSNYGLKYKVVIVEDMSIENKLDSSLIKYNIKNGNSEPFTNILKNTNKMTGTLEDGTTVEENSYVLTEGRIASLEKVEFVLKLWLSSEMTNENQKKKFKGLIKIYAEYIS